jgi:hypothetical protein
MSAKYGSSIIRDLRNRSGTSCGENAERLASEAGIEIEFIRKRNLRKEDWVKEALARRGEQPGLVCILSAMEPGSTYEPGGRRFKSFYTLSAGRGSMPCWSRANLQALTLSSYCDWTLSKLTCSISLKSIF